MLLALRDIYEAPRCDPQLLETIDPVTQDEMEAFSAEDWEFYGRGLYNKTLLPELGAARYFRSRDDPVIPLAGKRWRLRVLADDSHEVYEAAGKYLSLEETDEPETVPDCEVPEKNYRGRHYWQVFGQPTWVQTEHFPAATDGSPCRHLVTIENDWGDCGNWNILVSLGPAGLPDVAYFEASGC